jgi:hypothetical protein
MNLAKGRRTFVAVQGPIIFAALELNAHRKLMHPNGRPLLGPCDFNLKRRACINGTVA